jgi:hypothetical protein
VSKGPGFPQLTDSYSEDPVRQFPRFCKMVIFLYSTSFYRYYTGKASLNPAKWSTCRWQEIFDVRERLWVPATSKYVLNSESGPVS